jgi:hypothetical protein
MVIMQTTSILFTLDSVCCNFVISRQENLLDFVSYFRYAGFVIFSANQLKTLIYDKFEDTKGVNRKGKSKGRI